MLHTNVHTGNPWQRPILPTPKIKRIDAVWGAIGLVLAVMLVFVWWTVRAPSPTAPLSNSNQVLQGNAHAAIVSVRRGDLSDFEQNARNLAAANSPASLQTLTQFLKQSEPLSQRSIVLTALKDASPAVVPVLMTGLNDPDQGVRAGVAQVLGLRLEYPAIAALTEATRDQNASVRREAVKSLGAIDAWQALPRLEQLLVNEENSDVRQAASVAKEAFMQQMALEIGVPASQLRDLSVTTGNLPRIYAVTSTDLYTRHGTEWTLVSRLPDAPQALATGNEPTLIYLATVSAGLYRSLDGGETWEYVQFGLQTPTHLTITAIVVDPQNSQQVYIALASPGAEPGVKDPMGITVSKDDGATWSFLEDSPMDAVITRLVIDPQWQGNMFGMAADTPWRYALPSDVPNTD